MIKHTLVKGLFFIFLLAFFYSCTSLRQIGIEVSVAPDYPIANDVQSLVLLNRSMNSQFSNLSSDSLEKYFIKKHMALDTIFLDSLAADTVIHVTAKALYESGRYDVVVPIERDLVRNNINDVDNPLKIDYISQICSDYKVDAALVLEGFTEELKSVYSMSKTDGPLENYSASTDLIFESDWRLYRKDPNKKVIRFQVGDTINWKGFDYDLEILYKRKPILKVALQYGGVANGRKIAKYISPGWVQQTRYYYVTGHPEIDCAITFINENQWENAAAIWENYANISSKSTRSKVEFNLALAAEMNNDFDLAIKWGFKSFKSKYSKAAKDYLKTLDLRRKQVEKDNAKITF